MLLGLSSRILLWAVFVIYTPKQSTCKSSRLTRRGSVVSAAILKHHGSFLKKSRINELCINLKVVIVVFIGMKCTADVIKWSCKIFGLLWSISVTKVQVRFRKSARQYKKEKYINSVRTTKLHCQKYWQREKTIQQVLYWYPAITV